MNKSELSAFTLAIALFVSTVALGQSVVKSPVPSDEEIHRILTERVGNRDDRVGIVIGVIEPAGRRVVAHGSLDKNDKRSLDGDTVFEIGSITKVFTSLLLADMVLRDKVALTDPVAKYLPSGVRVPERGGHAITLEDLARHRSALPRLPTNIDAGADPKNPYAHYSVKQLYEFFQATSCPGISAPSSSTPISVAACSDTFWRLLPVRTMKRSS